MNELFEQALTEFLPSETKEKKADYLAKLCAEGENKRIICYQTAPAVLQGLLRYKPARLLAVASRVSAELKKIASGGKHMIAYEGTLNDVQDRVFDTAIFRPVSMLTEDLDELIGQAQRLLDRNGTLIFLGDAQEKMYVSLIRHNLETSGFCSVRFLSDRDFCYISCKKAE